MSETEKKEVHPICVVFPFLIYINAKRLMGFKKCYSFRIMPNAKMRIDSFTYLMWCGFISSFVQTHIRVGTFCNTDTLMGKEFLSHEERTRFF